MSKEQQLIEALAVRLVEVRKGCGWARKDVADRLNVSATTVQTHEEATSNKGPTFLYLVNFCAIAKMPFSEFVAGLRLE